MRKTQISHRDHREHRGEERGPSVFLSVSSVISVISVAIFAVSSMSADSRVKDIATVEGVRDNPLVGYGMVVGLRGTGDSQQTVFSMQTLANILQRMGLQVPSGSIRANN